jgi:uncharacterized protein YgiM (DUF1202 family)
VLEQFALTDRRKRCTWVRVAGFVVFVCAMAAAVRSQVLAQQAPYVAYVNTDEVYVRSGPGKNYYPTQKLQRGDEVEVYRHDPGGWFAIRPPAGSFSWVSGEYVQAIDEQNGKVIGDRVVARVGSEFSDVRDVIQVRLTRGEPLTILGFKEFNPGPAAQTWYKIAPPSGEFRWIHGRFVSERLEELEQPQGPRRNLLIPDDAQQADLAPAHELNGDVALTEHHEERDAMPLPKGNIEQGLARRAAPRLASPDEVAGDGGESGDLDHESGSFRVAARTPSAQGCDTRSREESLSLELDQIDLDLSAMVAQEPTVWYFDDLYQRANAALDRGETALERGRARLVLNRIEKFADIKRRHDALHQPPAVASQATRARDRYRTPTPPASRDGYDGVGRLARVQSDQPGMPAYALTDAAGEVRYFVTPAPGVNLRHYIGKEVGITGNRGYAPDLEQEHVTARRVTVLGDSGVLRR